MYRLYREATRYVDGKYVKDLSHLNRDLSKVIIMDSNPESFSMQPENGIALKPWTGEVKDQGLLEYIPFLEGKWNKCVYVDERMTNQSYMFVCKSYSCRFDNS